MILDSNNVLKKPDRAVSVLSWVANTVPPTFSSTTGPPSVFLTISEALFSPDACPGAMLSTYEMPRSDNSDEPCCCRRFVNRWMVCAGLFIQDYE